MDKWEGDLALKHMTNQISNTYMIIEFRFPCRVGKGLVCQRNRRSKKKNIHFIYSFPYLLNDLQMQTVILSVDPSHNPACHINNTWTFSFCDLKSVCFANFYLFSFFLGSICLSSNLYLRKCWPNSSHLVLKCQRI